MEIKPRLLYNIEQATRLSSVKIVIFLIGMMCRLSKYEKSLAWQ